MTGQKHSRIGWVVGVVTLRDLEMQVYEERGGGGGRNFGGSFSSFVIRLFRVWDVHE